MNTKEINQFMTPKTNMHWMSMINEIKENYKNFEWRSLYHNGRDITMYRVGENSTHEFWLGRSIDMTDKQTFTVETIGMCFNCNGKGCKKCQEGVETRLTEYEALKNVYLGHF